MGRLAKAAFESVTGLAVQLHVAIHFTQAHDPDSGVSRDRFARMRLLLPSEGCWMGVSGGGFLRKER